MRKSLRGEYVSTTPLYCFKFLFINSEVIRQNWCVRFKRRAIISVCPTIIYIFERRVIYMILHHLFLSLLATSTLQLGNPTIAPQTVH